ncbi:MAG: hypothetical protein ACREER_04890 [Alphaproteobacteria bacterium]
MPIDVRDPELNVVLNVGFYAMVACAVLSLVPWRLRDGRNRWSLALPVVAASLYLVYETTMPARWDIRVDLFVIWPLLIVTLGAGLIRLVLVLRRRPPSNPTT